MEPLRFQVKVTAIGEVRDAAGLLISTEPVEAIAELTADELTRLGIPTPQVPLKEKKS